MMKINWKSLLACLVIPLAIGGLAGYLTSGSMQEFAALTKPPFSPPGWVFPVVWTVLYLLMGISCYLVSQTKSPYRLTALRIYGIQLVVNFFWPILFFRLGLFLGAFFWLILLLILVVIMTVLFFKVKPLAGYLQIPYVLWLLFAGYLNYAIYLLN